MDADALANAVAERSDLPRGTVDRVLVALQDAVRSALRRNEDVAVAGFGVWNRPVRHDDTPDFEFLIPVGPLAVHPPEHFREGSKDESNIRSVADFLMRNPVLEETFGADRDSFPDLGPNLHPGIVTSREVYASAMSGVRPSFTPDQIGDRMVLNMRAVFGVA